MSRPVPVLILTLAFGATCSAQDKKATLSKDAVDDDFAVQGEYEGTLSRDGNSQKYGVQVIARGDGKFDAVGYPGGLPGAGWDGEDKVAGAGRREGDEVVISNSEGNAQAVIQNGRMTLSVDDEELGELQRTVRKSPTLGAKPPEGALVLFDGDEADLENFLPGARIENGNLRESFTTNEKFGDYTLHLEFMLSYMPQARGQARSNSGVYQQGRYEVQVLDSFGLEGADNECGGIYKAAAPSVNMCLPPLQWQTYDIEFTAAKYDGDKEAAPARITVKHNGVVIHDDIEIPSGTPGGTQAAGPGPGPIFVQNHGNPLYFRNLWIVPGT